MRSRFEVGRVGDVHRDVVGERGGRGSPLHRQVDDLRRMRWGWAFLDRRTRPPPDKPQSPGPGSRGRCLVGQGEGVKGAGEEGHLAAAFPGGGVHRADLGAEGLLGEGLHVAFARNGRSSGEHVAVPCALLSSRMASPWKGAPIFSRKPNSFGFGNRVRKMAFLRAKGLYRPQRWRGPP